MALVYFRFDDKGLSEDVKFLLSDKGVSKKDLVANLVKALMISTGVKEINNHEDYLMMLALAYGGGVLNVKTRYDTQIVQPVNVVVDDEMVDKMAEAYKDGTDSKEVIARSVEEQKRSEKPKGRVQKQSPPEIKAEDDPGSDPSLYDGLDKNDPVVQVLMNNDIGGFD